LAYLRQFTGSGIINREVGHTIRNRIGLDMTAERGG